MEEQNQAMLRAEEKASCTYLALQGDMASETRRRPSSLYIGSGPKGWDYDRCGGVKLMAWPEVNEVKFVGDAGSLLHVESSARNLHVRSQL